MPPELFHVRDSIDIRSLNPALYEGFVRHESNPAVKRTHLFNGRYENVYLKEEHVPELAAVLAEATRLAESILGVRGLRAGCWFNFMPPGAVTTKHTHDDGDERLSGVYYVRAPENSGNLVIHDGGQRHVIEPREGRFVFFGPGVPHEVTTNNSRGPRLSIGINFGLPRDDEID